MVESIDLQYIGSFLSETTGPPVFPVEIAGIGHPGPSGKDCRAVGESVDVNVRGHLCVRQDFRTCPISFDSHDVDEHPVVLFIAEHHLIMGSKT